MTQSGSSIVGGTREGDVIAGKYRIEKILGMGGMGVVVAAHHLQLDERVAIKFLLPEVLGNTEAVGRFAREARAAVKIKSEHVARVIDVGSLENGAPFMVMEYLDGGDLSAWLEQRGALPIEQAVEFVLQACEAIAEAHGLGIVHRDLKPANLFCVRRPDGVLSVKVLDFGISKLTGSLLSGSGMGMTRTTSVMGSPLYMSPEQLQSSRDVDARSDIWSLGAILYELLARQVPFGGETLPELCIKIVNQPTPLIRSVRPDIPVGLEQVISKCLEKDRNRRYPNVAELAVAMAPYGPKRARASVERVRGIIQSAGLSASVMALPPSSDAGTQLSAAETNASWGHTAPEAKRGWRKRMVVVLGGLALVALVTAGLYLFREQPSKSLQTAATHSAAIVVAPSVQVATSAQRAAAAVVPVEASSTASSVPASVPAEKPLPVTPSRRPRDKGSGKPLPSPSASSLTPQSPKNPPNTPDNNDKADWLKRQY